MNKTEISEIRKLFSKDGYRIDSLSACYVSIEKEKTFVLKEALHTLSEEELKEHLDIFKKSLGGTLGKNLINLEFPLEAEFGEGQQKLLLELRNSGLKDEAYVDKFFDKVIAAYPTDNKYYIVLIHGSYDVPGKAKDGQEMFDASEIIYEYILCAICPVKLTKAALGYNPEDNRIGEIVRDWVVEAPEKAFLFPAFDDRAPNIHNLLYYTKKAEDVQPEFVTELFGTTSPLTQNTQKETFNSLVLETLEGDVSFETVKRVQENISEVAEIAKETKEAVELTSYEVKELLKKSGIEEEKLDNFEETFKEIAGENTSIAVGNLPGVRQFNIKTPDIEIKVKPESAYLISHKIVDGVPSLVIPAGEGVEVNGIEVKYLESME